MNAPEALPAPSCEAPIRGFPNAPQAFLFAGDPGGFMGEVRGGGKLNVPFLLVWLPLKPNHRLLAVYLPSEPVGHQGLLVSFSLVLRLPSWCVVVRSLRSLTPTPQPPTTKSETQSNRCARFACFVLWKTSSPMPAGGRRRRSNVLLTWGFFHSLPRNIHPPPGFITIR